MGAVWHPINCSTGFVVVLHSCTGLGKHCKSRLSICGYAFAVAGLYLSVSIKLSNKYRGSVVAPIDGFRKSSQYAFKHVCP